jgi:hypothetical protein
LEDNSARESVDEELERCRAIWAVRNRGGENLEEASVGLEGKTHADACRFRLRVSEDALKNWDLRTEMEIEARQRGLDAGNISRAASGERRKRRREEGGPEDSPPAI